MTTFAVPSPPRSTHLAIEVPSWAYGNSGTRFKVFGSPGTPRTVEEKIADAATVHQFTGLAPSVALHIPWDSVDDFGKLAAYAADLGVARERSTATRSRTTTTSWAASPTPTRRSGARRCEHNLACIEVMSETGPET